MIQLPTMYLKSLELNGFKSFAKKIELQFETPIVAIVGPNGSGKSNIAESFRFVLGEQSIKSMRGKKGEDLIWNGSKNLGKLNRAGVKVIFDNSRRTFNVDFDEVLIERVVYRDGENEYLLNGSRVRLRDIIELLASANIGASGHHIISQGEADHMLNASIKERREMIEDALGLKIYQYKKQESERKLEKTGENIKQVEGLRREVQPHLKFLEKQMEKVEKAKNLREELTSLFREYLKREETYLSKEKTRIEEKKQKPEEELKVVNERIESLRKNLSESEADKNRTALLSAEKVLREREEEREGIRLELSKTEGMLIALERALDRIKPNGEKVSIELTALEDAAGSWEDILNKASREENISSVRALIKEALNAWKNFIEKHRKGAQENKERADVVSHVEKLFLKRRELEESLKKAEEEQKTTRKN